MTIAAVPVPSAGAADPEKVEKSDLVIIARAPGAYSAATVEELIEDAVNKSEGKCRCSEISVDPISAPQYELLKLMIESPEQFADVGSGRSAIEYYPDAANRWRVFQSDPHARLAGISVRYEVNKANKDEFFPAADANDESARFRKADGVGEYAFRSEEDWTMKGYVLHSEKPAGPAADGYQTWPEKRRYYRIRLADYEGGTQGPKAVFDRLNTGANPLQVSAVKAGMFTTANFRSVIASCDWIYNGNLCTIRFPRTGGKDQPTRLWILFPLNEAEAKEADTFLTSRNLTPKTFAQAFEEGDLMYPVIRADANPQTPLAVGSNWYEIPAVLDTDGNPLHYSRSFRIEDVPVLLDRFSDSTARMIVAYEGALKGDGGNVIGKRMQLVTSESRLWVVQEALEWLGGLKKLFAESEKTN